eukprot:4484033-Amphidinium_carterae.3
MKSATATTRFMDYYKTTLQDYLSTLTTIEDTSQQEANIPNILRTPLVPSQQEVDEHNLMNLPYRDWCKHCVQGKSKSQHHQCGGLTKQSITQVDYACMKSDNDKHNSTVHTMSGSSTGLGYALYET